ncbi:flagellar hook-length control protein FliK [Pseudomonas sp. NPDC090202]|uniref:flagellar hook-length control protein FliK n=1 Tax=unclassified Pseudomonas TaxID=196821 RepID=UPI00380EBDC4
MTADIPNLSPVAAATALLRAGVPAGEVLKLMEPRAGLLNQGQVANAEVVSLKQLGQDFQLLLRLTLNNGQQTTLPVSSSLPLTPGTTVNVAQGTADTLTISVQDLQKAITNSLTSIDTTQLPAGTLLQGKVLTTQVMAQNVAQLAGLPAGQPASGLTSANLPTVYRSIVLLLNTALAGSSLTIDSPQPLRVGSLLSAQVQSNQALNFIALPNRLDELALAQQLSTQQSRQASLQNLLTVLQSLPPPSDGNNDNLSPPLRASIEQLLADLPDLPQMSTAKGVAQALDASGLFMESRLQAGQNPALQPDLKANLLRVIAQILPGLPENVSYNAAAAANTLARVMPGIIRSALGTLGLVSAPAQAVNFPLPSRTLSGPQDKDDLEMLLKLAAGAISRLQSHQLSGLEQTRTNADGTQVTTWQTEIPMRNAHDIVPLQVKIQREDVAEREDSPERKAQEAAERDKEKLWRVELAFDLEPLGPLQVQAQLQAGSLSGQLWAERESSARLITGELDGLRARLVACGLNVRELACNRGLPPQGPRTVLEQRWIDENA